VNQKINIHETAFVTAAFRAQDRVLSGDPFAYLWDNEAITNHAERYSNAVSAYEGVAHCLRNRYFSDTLRRLTAQAGVEVFMNFGSGFSMYPYQLDPSILCIEIDTPAVISHKQRKTMEWQGEGKLPKRDIVYFEADFNSPSFESLYKDLYAIKKGRKSFILLEGVLFFLGKQDTVRLFKLFNRLQGHAEYVGSVSFLPELELKPAFGKLIAFVEGNLEKNQQFSYQTVPDEFYNTLDHYQLEDHQHTFSLSARYVPKLEFTEDEVLNEHMYLLKKHLK
jgi:O-methyltransferase involved in polyketide biosynthesis